MKKNRWTEARGREVIREWQQSGQSLSAFATERGWNVQRLYYWRERVLEADDERAEVEGGSEMRLLPGVVVGGEVGDRVRIALPRGVVVEANVLLTPEWVAALAGALEVAK